MQKIISFIRLGTLLSLLANCSITPPDVPLCTEINPSRGYCINTISSQEYVVSDTQTFEGQTWWELRPTMIYMPTKSWVKLKTFIIKVCKKTGQCSNKNVSSWERTVEAIDVRIAK